LVRPRNVKLERFTKDNIWEEFQYAPDKVNSGLWSETKEDLNKVIKRAIIVAIGELAGKYERKCDCQNDGPGSPDGAIRVHDPNCSWEQWAESLLDDVRDKVNQVVDEVLDERVSEVVRLLTK